jgi:hypothetical protein
MDLRLQLLESLVATGSDGNDYKICAYDRLLPVPGLIDSWEPSGQVEYRLEDGRRVAVWKNGTAFIAGTDVLLTFGVEAAAMANGDHDGR